MSGTVDFDQEVTAQAPSSPPPVTTGFSTNSFVQRAITVIIQLGQGSFGKSGFNTITLEGLRIAATIQKNGFPGLNVANLRIYGVPLDIMNQLTSLGTLVPLNAGRNNIVTIQAGDAINGMATVFKGNTITAWADLSDMPETFLEINAQTGAIEAMTPVPPSSFPNGADVATVMSGLATLMGRKLENNNVRIQLPPSYFSGTALAQAHACARAARIEMYVSEDGLTLAIWPRNSNRAGAIPLISPATGMLGYPQYTSNGAKIRTIFNPSIVFGGQIQVQSSVQPANGIWKVNDVVDNLSSQMPGGPWFSDIQATKYPGAPPPS
jgi:hypothetical protein